MRNIEIRRYRGLIDDLVGGTLTFLLELSVVVGLGVIALGVASIVLALV
jgi:hypothetical protein